MPHTFRLNVHLSTTYTQDLEDVGPLPTHHNVILICVPVFKEDQVQFVQQISLTAGEQKDRALALSVGV